jgi:acyl-CoA synthetase (AMP-forming)/AMP-acid ligase II
MVCIMIAASVMPRPAPPKAWRHRDAEPAGVAPARWKSCGKPPSRSFCSQYSASKLWPVAPAHAAVGRRAEGGGPAQGRPRVATLCWNHHAHLEAYFGIPAAGGVMHTLNLRLAPAEIGWIAADAKDRFLIVDDILLPLYRQFAELHRFERVIVFPFSGAPVPRGLHDYEQLLAGADADGFVYAPHDENDPVAMCYTSGTTGRPKGVAYSHRSDHPAHAGRQPGRLLGPEGHRRADAGDADVPRQLLGHARMAR